MRYTRRRPALLLCTLTALIAPIYGCDNTLEPNPERGGAAFQVDPALQPEVVEGRLAFRDMEHFEGYVKQLGDAAGAGDLAKAEGELAGFRSLRGYLDSNEWTEESATSGKEGEPSGNEAAALEKDGVVRADFPVSDQLLSVLNQEGEVQIEKEAFKLTRDHVYQVSVENLGLLDQVETLSSAPPAEKDERLTVREVETTEVRDGAVDERNSVAASMLGTCHVYAGSNYRMRGSTSITNLWFYAEARVTTEWQRKKSFLWWSWWANQWQSGTLRHEWSGNLYYGLWGSPLAGPVPVSGSQTGTGTDRISNNLLWMVGWGVRVAGTLNAKHYVNNWAVVGSCAT